MEKTPPSSKGTDFLSDALDLTLPTKCEFQVVFFSNKGIKLINHNSYAHACHNYLFLKINIIHIYSCSTNIFLLFKKLSFFAFGNCKNYDVYISCGLILKCRRCSAFLNVFSFMILTHTHTHRNVPQTYFGDSAAGAAVGRNSKLFFE